MEECSDWQVSLDGLASSSSMPSSKLQQLAHIWGFLEWEFAGAIGSPQQMQIREFIHSTSQTFLLIEFFARAYSQIMDTHEGKPAHPTL
jgi:hypothetical protein